MGITRGVVEAQNAQRKAFLQHLRRAQSQAAAANTRWARLRDHHTHPRGKAAHPLALAARMSDRPFVFAAVWHEPRSYPSSWQLDATEGPGRVRVRLRPAPLDIPPRFLKPHARHKAGESPRAFLIRRVRHSTR